MVSDDSEPVSNNEEVVCSDLGEPIIKGMEVVNG